MTTKFSIIISLILVLTTCIALHAAVINVPADYSVIQTAINNSQNGDTVLVAPGTYQEFIYFNGKLITLKSTDGPLVTTITYSDDFNLVTFRDGENELATIEGFTLKGGDIGIRCINARPRILRNIITGQTTDWAAVVLGGYGAVVGDSPAEIINNTIVNNVAGGIASNSSSPPIVFNNIMAFCGEYGLHGTVIKSYNLYYGNPEDLAYGDSYGSGSITGLDPLFNFDYSLAPGSPCIDVGNPNPFWNDSDGTRSDIGAVPGEYPDVVYQPITRFVPSEYESIQFAIASSYSGDTVEVAPGTYNESINFLGKDIYLKSDSGPKLTKIIGIPEVDVISIINGEGPGTIVEGFHIEGGRVAINCNNSSPVLRYNLMTHTEPLSWSGGIAVTGDAVIPAQVYNNSIVGTSSSGIFIETTTPQIIKNNLIVGCQYYGITLPSYIGDYVEPILSYNLVYQNSAGNYRRITDTGIGSLMINPKLLPGILLSSSSPCINAGDPDPSYNDSDGSRNDIGAFPFDDSFTSQAHYVPSDFATIQGAVDAAEEGDTIFVADGEYEEVITIDAKLLILISENGPENCIIKAPAVYSQNDDLPIVLIRDVFYWRPLISGFTIDGDNRLKGMDISNLSIIIENNIIKNCYSTYGSAGLLVIDAGFEIQNNSIHNNYSYYWTAGIDIIENKPESESFVTGNLIYYNNSTKAPAILTDNCNDLSITNNIIFENLNLPNTYPEYGSVFLQGIDLNFNNNTVDRNFGGVVIYDQTSLCSVNNNIFTNNAQYAVRDYFGYEDSDSITVDYNLFFDNETDLYAIGQSPSGVFADPEFESTSEADYFLSPTSPAIDAGDPDESYNDPDGSRNDIGARPYEAITPIPPPTPTVIKIPNDYPTIQQALFESNENDTILVSPGTYDEILYFGNKELVLTSETGAEETILHPTSQPIFLSPVSLSTQPSEDKNEKLVIRLTRPAVVNFRSTGKQNVIFNGFTINGDSLRHGMFGEDVSPTVSNNIITNCDGSFYTYGGGILFSNSSPKIINNTIYKNYGLFSAGGIYLGLARDNDTAFVINNNIYDNFSITGSALEISKSFHPIAGRYAVVTQNLIHHNTNGVYSTTLGAVTLSGSLIHFYNNTIDNNASGLTQDGYTANDIYNNNITNNDSFGIQHFQSQFSNDFESDYNNLYNNGDSTNYIGFEPPENDISVDPLYLPDYFLSPTSPCVDAGNPDPFYNDPDGSRNDIGARTKIPYLPGDCNADGFIDIADLVFLVSYQFNGGNAPIYFYLADFNNDSFIDITDLVNLVEYMFSD